jgi:2-polyprenyl-6-methoxyphenol hydroxylase-like FAD-dependent oxidoreductase
MLFHRRMLLDLLYRTLPEKEQRIITEKKVISIESNSHGVKVRCDDGSIEEGSIVIGCDGVHSHVREIMNDLVPKISAGVHNSEKPMVAHYQLLAGHLRRNPNLEAGRLWEIRNDGLCLQIFMLEHEGWFLIYRRLPEPAYQYHRYTDKDAETFAMEIKDYPTNQSMNFGDLWEDRKWVRLVNIEEGFIQRWHQDRIVLVGDSVHKMTPNAGLNVNQGWQGVVALTNLLRRLLLTNPDPDNKSLAKAFGEYQKMTEKTAKQSLMLSKLYTRVTSWHNIVYKMMDSVGQWLGGDLLLFRILASPIVKQGLILDFVPETGYKAGRIKWDN